MVQPNPDNDIHVAAVVKDDNKYIFMFDDQHYIELLRTIGRFSCNPELNFSYREALALLRQIRDQRKL